MKDTHVAGDTLDETVVIPDYPATDGWTLKYFFVPRFTTPTQAPITLTATPSGSDYLIQASPSTTAGWVPGVYSWRRRVEKSGAAQTLDKNGNGGDWSGEFVLEPDPSTLAQGYDGRSQAVKALEDALAALATYHASSGNVKRYAIAGREMEFSDAAQIESLINFWQRKVETEAAQARLAKNQPGAPRLLARL